MVVGRKKLTQEVPYLGGNTELAFYVEGLRFPDKDFDGLITINLSLLEPSGKVSETDHRPILNETCRTLNVLFLVLFCLSAFHNNTSSLAMKVTLLVNISELLNTNYSSACFLKKDIPETPIFTDKVTFHVSPWIMTPNTLKPVEVYVCR